jgi:hypothetical protein
MGKRWSSSSSSSSWHDAWSWYSHGGVKSPARMLRVMTILLLEGVDHSRRDVVRVDSSSSYPGYYYYYYYY